MNKTKFIYAIYFLIGLVFLISCNNQNKEPIEFKYKTVIIEDCEYIQYYGSMGYLHITHKGNCKNIIHYNNADK